MEPTNPTTYNALTLWRRLLVRALRRGVPYADAQDLAGHAILNALEAFAPERGDFVPFCGTIHSNLLRNWWRDRKPTEPWEEDRHDGPGDDDPSTESERRELQAMHTQIADLILAELDPEEAALFLTLGDQCRKAERAAVSSAARQLGIEPLAAWNVFRRIQRKARPFLARFLALAANDVEPFAYDVGVVESRKSSILPERDMEIQHLESDSEAVFRSCSTSWIISPLAYIAAGGDAGFGSFAEQLTAEQRGRLFACLS